MSRHRALRLCLAAAVLSAGGCGLLSPSPPVELDLRADYFRTLGLSCGAPDASGESLTSVVVECRGALAGVQSTVRIDPGPGGRPLMAMSVSEDVGRPAAVDAWSRTLAMPGLATVRLDVAAGLEEWASGGAALFAVARGLAWISTGEGGEWTLNIEPDREEGYPGLP